MKTKYIEMYFDIFDLFAIPYAGAEVHNGGGDRLEKVILVFNMLTLN